MSNWQPARVVDFILRFNADFGPAIRASVEGAAGSRLPPDDQAREACRAIARGVGVATHAYVWGAGDGALTAVRLPVNADLDGVVIALRLHLNTPMTTPIDYSSGQQVAALLQTIMGLPKGSLARAEVLFPTGEQGGSTGPLLTTLNPRTLPGQKLCEYCRNPMPAYEVQCMSCGGRAES